MTDESLRDIRTSIYETCRKVTDVSEYLEGGRISADQLDGARVEAAREQFNAAVDKLLTYPQLTVDAEKRAALVAKLAEQEEEERLRVRRRLLDALAEGAVGVATCLIPVGLVVTCLVLLIHAFE